MWYYPDFYIQTDIHHNVCVMLLDVSISTAHKYTAKNTQYTSMYTRGVSTWRLSVISNQLSRPSDASEMEGLREILRVSWTANKTTEWVLNQAGVKKELLDTVKARELAYYGHTMREQESWLVKEIIEVHVGKEDHARPGWTTSWRGQDSPWKSQSECKYVHSVANPRTATQQNRITYL